MRGRLGSMVSPAGTLPKNGRRAPLMNASRMARHKDASATFRQSSQFRLRWLLRTRDRANIRRPRLRQRADIRARNLSGLAARCLGAGIGPRHEAASQVSRVRSRRGACVQRSATVWSTALCPIMASGSRVAKGSRKPANRISIHNKATNVYRKFMHSFARGLACRIDK
jgi:hypothetical protein